MVQSSVRAESPIIGIQLSSAYEPSKIACLCESHNLYLEQEADRKRYNELTEDGPGIRMKLLAGLLRVADILEESRRRATRPKAGTLLLDITSQKHWWRHYYTEDVVFNQADRSVVIWFDFPPDKFDSYSRIIPELQKPWIEAEFNRHAATFNKYAANWTVKAQLKVKQYSNTLSMPDTVTTAMISELQSRHLKEDERRRAILLSTFQESRPHIEQRLDQLREKKSSMSPGEYLKGLSDLSNELWEIGSKRSAIMNLVFEFDRSNQQLATAQRMEIGTRLLEMCLEEGSPNLVKGWVPALLETARNLDQSHRYLFPCLRAIANWFVASCDYASAKQVFSEAIKATTDQDEILLLNAICRELDFANGELGSIIGTSELESLND
ncbi:hypothetical protein Enr13x_51710 [Stieleria neptunia]|uniref:HD-CE domain-containing protein n=1 Tax=Stieleria neptunia TaxID=2527979 RepID=A0A518HWQ6_9BACT|nr:hypothetical protein [Stieleria neptunia]QDV45295.1 hypothetical protein Enr13x_51710 [Stieleria neptunia]